MGHPTRKPFVAANWKMNTDLASGSALAREVCAATASLTERVDVALCPPLVYLESVGRVVQQAKSAVMLGAQNAYFQPSGAFTGEVSCAMLKDVGCRCVIIGHSERRHVMGESDELVQKKLHAVLGFGLDAILCVGETLEERKAGRTDAVNERQVRTALAGLDAGLLARLTIAYEPVWAIGTGMTATPSDAQNAHRHIRGLVGSLYSEQHAQKLRIQYGGSVKPDNARELFAQADIDGGLIGGASLKAADFLAIVQAAV